jgi:hypothetical protein
MKKYIFYLFLLFSSSSYTSETRKNIMPNEKKLMQILNEKKFEFIAAKTGLCKALADQEVTDEQVVKFRVEEAFFDLSDLLDQKAMVVLSFRKPELIKVLLESKI